MIDYIDIKRSDKRTATECLEAQVPVDVLVMRQRAYREAIQPFIDAKVKVYSIHMPKMIMDENGNITSTYEFSEETKLELKALDDLIEMARKSILGA